METTTTKTKTAELPDKLSALIRLALNDLRKAEKMEKVRIDMSVFFVIQSDDELHKYDPPRQIPDEHKVCSVCFAGTVMIGTLGADIFDPTVTTTKWGNKNKHKFYALDHARQGDLIGALNDLTYVSNECADMCERLYKAYPNLSWKTTDDSRECYLQVPHYRDNPEAFKLRMEEIADALEGVDL